MQLNEYGCHRGIHKCQDIHTKVPLAAFEPSPRLTYICSYKWDRKSVCEEINDEGEEVWRVSVLQATDGDQQFFGSKFITKKEV